MVGIVGLIALLTVLGLSLVITKIATQALTMTGLSEDIARFQARSAFTGTGFTTSETEKVVKHPVRRKIVMYLMIARSAGLVTIIISLILSFGVGDDGEGRMMRLGWLIAGVGVLWVMARSGLIDRVLNRVIQWAIRTWTDLDTRDYAELFNLHGDYLVRELTLEEADWLAGRRLGECRISEEGVTVLGIYRDDGDYVGAPDGDTELYAEDRLILYGRAEVLQNLDERRKGIVGEREHEEAVSRQEKENAEQKMREREYRRKKDRKGNDTSDTE